MTFGEKVSYFRNKKGLSISELALQVGVSDRVINQYECDEYRPKNSVMYAFQLEMTVDYVYEYYLSLYFYL